MQKMIKEILQNSKVLTKNGNVAKYIPALGKADPNNLGVCVADIEGNLFTAGDYDKKFTIQSISKAITLMLAIMDNGVEDTFDIVGMEPTGDAFNSIIKLEIVSPSRPLNPMINAGAIAITSMIKGDNSNEKFKRILDFFRLISGNDKLDINQEVYESEKATGDRNRSMAYFMRDVGIFEGDVEDILDVYFKQCSIEVDCIDIAKIGLFLANSGKIPHTGERITTENIAMIVKTFMVTCGMYNASGEFAINVGIPSKSGVGGGIMGSVPHKMGIGVYGPALDSKGNSIGGIEILSQLSKKFNLSIF